MIDVVPARFGDSSDAGLLRSLLWFFYWSRGGSGHEWSSAVFQLALVNGLIVLINLHDDWSVHVRWLDVVPIHSMARQPVEGLHGHLFAFIVPCLELRIPT